MSTPSAVRTAAVTATHPRISLRRENAAPRFRVDEGEEVAQRASDEETGCQLFFIGRLFERGALSGRMGSETTASTNDAELLLRAFLREGENLLRRLKGNFVVAIWDPRAAQLVCLRDPLGSIPLFYARAGADLVVSTSIDGVLEDGHVSKALNRPALADHICLRWPDPGETYFEAIRRVPPGFLLRANAANEALERYWDPAGDSGEDLTWVDEDELDRFDELLDQAVRRALEFGPAGIFLSGGLDSVSVAAVAADVSRAEGFPAPRALSLGFPDPSCNEEETQRSVAADLGLPLTFMQIADATGGNGIIAAAVASVDGLPSPLMNIWYPAYRRLGVEAERDGCAVILTGGGGDEWLGVSPYIAADFLRRLDFPSLFRLWNTLQRSYQPSRRKVLRNVLWTFGAREILRDLVARRARWYIQRRRRRSFAERTPSWVAPDSDLRSTMRRRIETDFIDSEAKSSYLREGRLAFDHALTSMSKEELYVTRDRGGLPVVMPYWDPDLVDLLYRTPPDLLNRGDRSKGLVRGMLSKRFPELGFEQHKKIVATSYFRKLITQEGPAVWKETGGPVALADLGIVDPHLVRADAEDMFSGKHMEYAYRIWEVLNLEAWVRSRG